MYTIRADGNVLYDPRVAKLAIFEGVLNREDNCADNFTFKIYSNHPMYTALCKLKTTIELYDDGELLFRGRVLNDSPDWDNGLSVTCEGELAFLADSVVRPYNWDNKGVADYLTKLLTDHNAQVEQNRQILPGIITVTDPNDKIVRASGDYPSTLSELKTKLPDLLGGHLLPRRENDVTYLDYLLDSDLPESHQVIELGCNLLDLKRENRGEEIATRIVPLGAKIESQEGKAGEERRLTIASVNSGRDYLEATDMVGTYGLVTQVRIFDDVTTAQVLKQRGQAALDEAVLELHKIELTAIDLSLINANMDRLRFMHKVQVVSKPHGLNLESVIKKQTLDILHPENNKIEVGAEFSTFTQSLTKDRSKLEDINNRYVGMAEIGVVDNKVGNVQKEVDQVVESINDRFASLAKHVRYPSDTGALTLGQESGTAKVVVDSADVSIYIGDQLAMQTVAGQTTVAANFVVRGQDSHKPSIIIQDENEVVKAKLTLGDNDEGLTITTIGQDGTSGLVKIDGQGNFTTNGTIHADGGIIP
jgi:hypothetical protein